MSKDLEPINRFTRVTKNNLSKLGYEIYSLTGHSLKSLDEVGMLEGKWFLEERFAAISARRSEVAINLQRIVLPESNFLNAFNQERMISAHAALLRRSKIKVAGVLGTVADYAELIYRHWQKTKGLLLGPGYDYGYQEDSVPRAYAITSTLTNVGTRRVIIGNFREDRGILVLSQELDSNSHTTWAFPLLIPLK